MKANIMFYRPENFVHQFVENFEKAEEEGYWDLFGGKLAGRLDDGTFWFQTTAGNQVYVKIVNTTFYVEIDATRHALHDCSNVAGLAMIELGLIDIQGNPTDLAKAVKVISYASMRKDCPWFVYNLEHPAVVEYRRKASAAGRRLPERLIFCDGVVKEEFDTEPVPVWEGVEHRRAAANGVSL